MKTIQTVVGITTMMLVFQAAPAGAGPAKNGKAVAYANVSLADGSVLSFGGNKTTAAVSEFGGVGEAAVIFTGKYPKDITIDQVIVQATCEYGGNCVANAKVVSATPTEIWVQVGGFESMTGNGMSNNAFVTVNVGQ